MDIVEDCINSHIFPLLGELELSGKGQTNYENLSLNAEELMTLKVKVEKLWGSDYFIPTCPAVINGIHINNCSNVTVDFFSGLSCHWFWLQEPKTTTLTHFYNISNAQEITNKIFDYRKKKIKDVKEYLESHSRIGGAFGGCGGDVVNLFNEYLKIHEVIK